MTYCESLIRIAVEMRSHWCGDSLHGGDCTCFQTV